MNEKIKKLKEIAFKYEELKEIQEKVQNFIKEYEDFKIPIVFIGEFSVGKSSLINKILDEDLLEVNTTPTTAKPYEICYSEEEKRYNKDGIEFLFLKNKNLKNIKNLKIVDLPGITSQYFEHTSIVENYLANKYVIPVVVMDASKGALSDEVISFIRGIKLNNQNFEYILVVNKVDRISEEEANRVLENTISILRDIYKEPIYACKTSVEESKISSLISILHKYNNKYDEIRQSIFIKQFEELVSELEMNLEQIKSLLSFLSESEIENLSIQLEELKNAEEELKSQQEEEIIKIRKKLEEEFEKFMAGLENYLYINFETYVKNPKRIETDIYNYIEREQPKLYESLENILQKTLFEIEGKLENLEILNKFLFNATKFASAGRIGELIGGVVGAGRIVSTAGWITKISRVLSHPITIIITIIATGVIGFLLDRFKRDKTKEAIRDAIQSVRRELGKEINKISERMSEEIINALNSEIIKVKDRFVQVINMIRDKKTEQKTKIAQIEMDIKILKGLKA
jgi:small GTP-binding protein